jgi:hypothetical protein
MENERGGWAKPARNAIANQGDPADARGEQSSLYVARGISVTQLREQ